MLVRSVMVGLASLTLAAFSSWHAALLHERQEYPEAAKHLFRSDPDLAVAGIEHRLSRSPSDLPNLSGSIEENARKAIALDPLNAAAMRQLGQVAAQRAGSEAGGQAQFSAAERITRRDLGTQYQLINVAAKSGDVAAALLHYNRILLVHVDARDGLFANLARSLSSPETRVALAAYANTEWFAGFLGDALRFKAEPFAVIETQAASASHLAKAESDARWLRLIGQLGNAGLYDAARVALDRAPGTALSSVSSFGIGPDTLDPNMGAFAWRLSSDSGVESGLGADGSLVIQMDGERLARIAQRTTLLGPGAYALSADPQYDAGSAKVALGWEMTCHKANADGGLPALSLEPAERSGRQILAPRLVIPDDCTAQDWRIIGRSEPTQTGARVTLARLELRRL